MNEVVQAAFRRMVEFLPSEFAVMPLNRWNESVMRYSFCRFLAMDHPEVEQFVECGKIDLVLGRQSLRAFVEFKFYGHPVRFDPYDGKDCGFKGGPGRKNLEEFQACVDQLHERRSPPSVSKYVVLIYADPTDGRRSDCRYSRYYDEYRHPRDEVALRLLESGGPIATKEGIVKARLFQVGCELAADSSQSPRRTAHCADRRCPEPLDP